MGPSGPVHRRFQRGSSVEVDDAHPDGLEHGLGAVPGVELLVDRRQVVLHRLLADVELLGHLGGGAAVGDELEDLFLPLGDDPVLLGGCRARRGVRTSSSIEAASWGERAVSPLAPCARPRRSPRWSSPSPGSREAPARMASASTSWSACMVSMTTCGSSGLPSGSAGWPRRRRSRASSRPSGRRRAGARRPGGRPRSPFAASPTTSKPSSVSERRRPSRSIRWSSASSSRIVTRATSEAVVRPSWLAHVVTEALEADAAYPRCPRPGSESTSRVAPMLGGPLPHAEDAVGVEAAGACRRGSRCRRRRPRARRVGAVAAPRDVTWEAWAWRSTLVTRLLGDAPQLPLLEEREAAGLRSPRSSTGQAAAVAAPGRGTPRAWRPGSGVSVTSVRRS